MPWPTFVLCFCLNCAYPYGCEEVSRDFDLHSLMMWRIISWVCWLFVNLTWRNVPVFCSFFNGVFCCWVLGVPYIFLDTRLLQVMWFAVISPIKFPFHFLDNVLIFFTSHLEKTTQGEAVQSSFLRILLVTICACTCKCNVYSLLLSLLHKWYFFTECVLSVLFQYMYICLSLANYCALPYCIDNSVYLVRTLLCTLKLWLLTVTDTHKLVKIQASLSLG